MKVTPAAIVAVQDKRMVVDWTLLLKASPYLAAPRTHEQLVAALREPADLEHGSLRQRHVDDLHEARFGRIRLAPDRFRRGRLLGQEAREEQRDHHR